MNLAENIKESIRSISSQRMRSVLTIITIAIGIACLVGMLTAIEGMRQSLVSDFAKIGANTLTVRSVNNRQNRRRGSLAKYVPPLTFTDVQQFTKTFDPSYGVPSLLSVVTNASVIRHGSNKTHPNKVIIGVDEDALFVHGVTLELGRNFSTREINSGAQVVIIGHEIFKELFEASGINPLEQYVIARGGRFRIIGKLKEIGTSEAEDERFFLIPMPASRRLSAVGQVLEYEVAIAVDNILEMDIAEEVAKQTMRRVRLDKPKDSNSFEIRRSDSASNSINNLAGMLTVGGYVLGFITLTGACIGLMNIMLVYVRERTREIGMRKAVGATAMEIRLQFLTEAVVICQIGGLVGILLGIALGNFTASFVDASFVFPYVAVLVGLFVSTLVGAAAGYVPARNAAAVDPIQSLRHE